MQDISGLAKNDELIELLDIHDPIVRLFASQLMAKCQTVASEAVTIVFDARKSVQNNRRITPDEKSRSNEAFSDLERAYRQAILRIPAIDSSDAFDLFREVIPEFEKAANFFSHSRRHF